MFPQGVKDPLSQTLHFPGKLSIPRERESYFQGKIIPERENFHSQGKFAQFALRGKICPKRCLGYMYRGGPESGREKIRKMPSGRYRYKDLLFQSKERFLEDDDLDQDPLKEDLLHIWSWFGIMPGVWGMEKLPKAGHGEKWKDKIFAIPPTSYRGLSGPSGPSVPGSVPENGGVRRSVPTGCLWGPSGPRLGSVQKSVPRVSPNVSKRCPGHSGDTFWTLRSLGPEGRQRHPVGHSVGHPRFRGHSPGHSGPKGSRDPCSWSAGSQSQMEKKKNSHQLEQWPNIGQKWREKMENSLENPLSSHVVAIFLPLSS